MRCQRGDGIRVASAGGVSPGVTTEGEHVPIPTKTDSETFDLIAELKEIGERLDRATEKFDRITARAEKQAK
jgi:CBS-domain-containing membrane protein